MTEIDKLLKTADEYYSNNQYLKAKEIYEGLAKYNPAVLYTLGYMYCEGKGVSVNYEKSIEYLEKALELELELKKFPISLHARIYNVLGVSYVKKEHNYKKAAELYEKAIELCPNITEPAYNLGIIYLQGQGVNKDYIKAIKLIAKGHGFCGSTEATRRIIQDDKVIKYVLENLAKVDDLKSKVEELEKEIVMLKAELMYQPGGEGYQAAKMEFEQLSKLTN